MAVDCLTEEEKNALRNIYRRDVKYWENWGPTVKIAKREGTCSLGISWVVLRFKPGPELPRMRQEMNDIYLQCLQEHAQAFNLSVCVDLKINKVVVYDPARAPAEWLDNAMMPGFTGRCN
jgi:hypothetical protein